MLGVREGMHSDWSVWYDFPDEQFLVCVCDELFRWRGYALITLTVCFVSLNEKSNCGDMADIIVSHLSTHPILN